MAGQQLQHPPEHLPMRFQVDQSACAADGRVIGARLVQGVSDKRPKTQGVAATPGDAAFGVDPLEVPDQQQPEVPSRLQARPAHRFVVEFLAQAFDVRIEAASRQNLVQLAVKRMRG